MNTRNPIPVEVVAQSATTYDEVLLHRGDVYWIEGKDGQSILMRHSRGGNCAALPVETTVGTDIYGYGGGAYAPSSVGLWYCHRGQIHRRTTAVDTHTVITRRHDNYGDLHWAPHAGLLFAVAEQGEAAEIVEIDRDGQERVLAVGEDFYAAPRTSPHHNQMSWLSWNTPHLPWDSTLLHTAALQPDGSLVGHTVVAGSDNESVLCPQWGPDRWLYYVSDRTGWWSLYRWRDGTTEQVLALDNAELGVAPWELGYSTYTFLRDGAIAAIVHRGPRHELHIHHRGRTRQLELPYTSIKPYLTAHKSNIAVIASSPTRTPAVVLVDSGTGAARQLTTPSTPLPAEQISQPEPFSFPGRDGHTCHGLYYPSGLPGDVPPPLIVRAHPGPTTNTLMRLEPAVQYFTSRGYAIADIDYRGSTGYGRAYRRQLDYQWGSIDAHDCADAARHLASTGRADPTRIVITGASAGGYTALHAATEPDTPFAAVTANAPIVNPTHWRCTVPRFQRSHTDTLIGPWPRARDTYTTRSLLEQTQRIRIPVLLIHGRQDPITPASDTSQLAQALDQAGTPCQLHLHDDGHQPRTPRTIAAILALEHAHYTHHLSGSH